MNSTLSHRGPDDQGTLCLPCSQGAFGHRRLSILDLSPAGHQPMTARRSDGSKVILSFNGEIYNFREIRSELAALGHSFQSDSDSEVIMLSFMEWGVEESLPRFVGMFAIAWWECAPGCGDGECRCPGTLTLIRDRLGIKPLYYGLASHSGPGSKCFVFGSELKALKAHPLSRFTLDTGAIALFLRHNYITAPWTVYRETRKLNPGSLLRLCPSDLAAGAGPDSWTVSSWWNVRKIASDKWNESAGSPIPSTHDEAMGQIRDKNAELEEIIGRATRDRLVSDVPLGAFLSGGIDSSLVVAMMAAGNRDKVKTFSIGFSEKGYDEAPFAREVARHLGTDHTEMYVGPQDALAAIPSIPEYWDEPFADSSQIPTSILCRLTRQHVTVALSGDGGDELFSGYRHHHMAADLWRKTRCIPGFARQALNTVLAALPVPSAHSRPGQLLSRAIEKRDLLTGSFQELYRVTVSHHRNPVAAMAAALTSGDNSRDFERATPFTIPQPRIIDNPHAVMSLIDLQSYLPEDILTKVDRASMAVALEARVPLLDHRVVEAALATPMWMKLLNPAGKAPLRSILSRHLPKALFERPKMGFGIPLGQWLAGPLSEWTRDTLSREAIMKWGILDVKRTEALVNGHMSGNAPSPYLLWDLLCLQTWLDRVHGNSRDQAPGNG